MLPHQKSLVDSCFEDLKVIILEIIQLTIHKAVTCCHLYLNVLKSP